MKNEKNEETKHFKKRHPWRRKAYRYLLALFIERKVDIAGPHTAWRTCPRSFRKLLVDSPEPAGKNKRAALVRARALALHAGTEAVTL